jgi:hypothetical protein
MSCQRAVWCIKRSHMDPCLPLTTHTRGSFSPPHESFKGSVEEWRSLTSKQRFDINNPGRRKELGTSNYAKKKDILQAQRELPENRQIQKELRQVPANKKKKQARELKNRDHLNSMARDRWAIPENAERCNARKRDYDDENREYVNDLKRTSRHKREATHYEMFGEGPY